jgi:hypothetical protein
MLSADNLIYEFSKTGAMKSMLAQGLRAGTDHWSMTVRNFYVSPHG